MSAVQTVTAWGTQRPSDVVGLAQEAGLELAAACALLDQESHGGRNVWGHDAVTVAPGTYVMGAEVTEQAYRSFRRALAEKRAGRQGVGPCQLTSTDYQDQADALGGCWLPVPNMRVGFRLLAGYVARWGMADAFRAYNGGAGNRVAGSNANADRYSRDAMAKLTTWRDRLGPHNAPTTGDDDMPLTDADVGRIADAAVTRLLNARLDDLYPSTPVKGSMTVATTLMWAAANAGRSLDVSRAVRDTLAKTGGASPELVAAIHDALEKVGPLELIPSAMLDRPA